MSICVSRRRPPVALLSDLFLERFAKERGAARRFDRACYETLSAYAWPGNVRELRNVVRYCTMWTESELVTNADLPPLDMAGPESPALSGAPSGCTSSRTAELEESLLLPIADARSSFDRVYAQRMLAESAGNQSEAARRSGMSRSAFRELLKRLEMLE